MKHVTGQHPVTTDQQIIMDIPQSYYTVSTVVMIQCVMIVKGGHHSL